MDSVDISLPGFNVLVDVKGDTSGVALSLAGNQWFVVDELVHYLNSLGFTVYVETIPPGLVRERALGKALRVGALTVNLRPEIVSLPPQMLAGIPTVDTFEYAESEVAVAYQGKPVEGLCDIRNRRVAIPNPVTEGIGALFRDMYSEACGDYLELITKGSVYLTRIHHREIPELMRHGVVDAGVMWVTEARYWGLPYFAPSTGRRGKLVFALLPWATDKARQLFRQLRSQKVKEIYEKYGFKWTAQP